MQTEDKMQTEGKMQSKDCRPGVLNAASPLRQPAFPACSTPRNG